MRSAIARELVSWEKGGMRVKWEFFRCKKCKIGLLCWSMHDPVKYVSDPFSPKSAAEASQT